MSGAHTRPVETPFQSQSRATYPLLSKNSSLVYEDIPDYDLVMWIHSQRGLGYDTHEIQDKPAFTNPELFSGNCVPITKNKGGTPGDQNNIFIIDQNMIVFTIDEYEIHPWIHQAVAGERIMASGDMRLGRSHGWLRIYNKEYWLKDVYIYAVQKTTQGSDPEDPVTGKRVTRANGILWTFAGIIGDAVTHQNLWL